MVIGKYRSQLLRPVDPALSAGQLAGLNLLPPMGYYKYSSPNAPGAASAYGVQMINQNARLEVLDDVWFKADESYIFPCGFFHRVIDDSQAANAPGALAGALTIMISAPSCRDESTFF